jgi:hypothetical protein
VVAAPGAGALPRAGGRGCHAQIHCIYVPTGRAGRTASLLHRRQSSRTVGARAGGAACRWRRGGVAGARAPPPPAARPAIGSVERGVVVGEMGMGVGHKEARGKR